MNLPNLTPRSSGAQTVMSMVPKPVRPGVTPGMSLAQSRNLITNLMLQRKAMDHAHAINNHPLLRNSGGDPVSRPLPDPGDIQTEEDGQPVQGDIIDLMGILSGIYPGEAPADGMGKGITDWVGGSIANNTHMPLMKPGQTRLPVSWDPTTLQGTPKPTGKPSRADLAALIGAMSRVQLG